MDHSVHKMARYRNLPLSRRIIQLSVNAVTHGHRPTPLPKVASGDHALRLCRIIHWYSHSSARQILSSPTYGSC